MGCSSSREARGDMTMAPAPATERRQSLRSRSVSRGASALSSLGFCRGRHDGVHAYSTLPLEEATKGGSAVVAAAVANASPGGAERRGASRTPTTKTPSGGKQGLMVALEDAASATSSTARWPASPTGHHVPYFDLGIMSGFRQTLVGPSPSHPAVLFPEQEAPPAPQETVEEPFDDMGTPAARDIPEVTGFVRARVDEFHERLEKKKKQQQEEEADEAPDVAVVVDPPRRPVRAGKAVVVYFTSLRGVRRTFEDGRAVRAILRCYRVRVDERDVSIHADFKAELGELLGPGHAGPTLPRVFVGGDRDLGGADAVRALHEAGELARALAGCEHFAAAQACAGCGDMRFLPCDTCYGSCKLFVGDEGCRLAGMFQRCPDCNENGLIRCPVCCYY